MGDTQGAAAAYANHVRAASRDPRLLEPALALSKGRIAVAEPLLREHLKQYPTDVAAIRMLAEVAARIGRYGDARDLLERCLELAPGFHAARHNLAVVLHRDNKPREALEQIDRLLLAEPGSPGLRNLRAAVHARIGEYAEALQLYAELLRQYPGQAKLWLSYGHALKTSGRQGDAVAAYRNAWRLEPAFGDACWSLANLKTFRFDPADIAAMRKQVASPALGHDDRLHFHFALGKALEDEKSHADSFEHYAAGNRLRKQAVPYDAAALSDQVRRTRAVFTPEFLAAREGRGCTAPDPIFILGLPRSGSTLVEQILASHPSVEGTMELPDVLGIVKSLGGRQRRDDASRYPEVLAELGLDRLRGLGERYLEQTRVQRKTTAPYFIDKMPNNWPHVGLIHLMLPNARIIDARRHPLSCCFSNFKQHFARGQNFTYSLDDLGRYYADYVALMTHFDAVLPGRVHRVVYERMVDDTEAEVRRLLDYCGLPFDAACLRFHENDRAVRTASSEQVRQPIYRDAVDQWRHYEPWLRPLRNALGPVLDAYPEPPTRSRKLQRLQRRPDAVLALAAGVPTLLAGMSAAYGQAPPGGLEEIVVTAQKRTEDIQSVPLSIQAFGTQRLDELNVQRFDDYVKFLPSVSIQSIGPGFAAVYMRGVASGGDGNHSGPSPSVGIYLDEQPITTIQGALDVHIYDIERVEALAGPQGTLYGASSQAGTIRIISNQPDPDEFRSGYGLEVNSVAHGGMGFLAEGFVNLPINDRMAVRLVGWHRHDAGYIDNVFGSRTYPSTLPTPDRPDNVPITRSNAGFVEDDYNDVDTTGARAALKIDLDDTWTITPQVMAQRQEANGFFGYDPDVGELEISHSFPEASDDQWVQAALTVEGRIANLDLIYAGSYLKRDVDTGSDYSDYAYWYDTQYLASGYYFSDYFYNDAGDPIDFAQYIQAKDEYRRYTHELRLASPAENRLRFVAGAFMQRAEHDIFQRYRIDDLAADLSVTGWEDTIWLTQQMRVDEEWALFGEMSFDFTDRLTGTVGARYFNTDNSLEGFFGFGAGYSDSAGEAQCPGGDAASAPDYEGAPCKVFDKTTSEDGYTPRVNVTYEIDADKMVYATYSEGYRPGGINRRGTLPPYLADWLKNYEFGWKTAWAGNRLRFNGAIFQQTWDDFQYALLGAQGLTEIQNAGQAQIRGIEMDVSWAVTDQLGLTAGVAYLDSELTENYCGFVDPRTGRPETRNPCPQPDYDDDGNLAGFVDTPPQAPEGTTLPVTPEWKANVTARYQFKVADFDSYAQGAYIYSGERRTDLRDYENSIVGDMPGFSIVDLSTGLGRDGWTAELFIRNAFDERAEVTRYAQCAEATCGYQSYTVPVTPRMIGLRFSQEF